jgi:hypothetical protein
MLLGLRYCYDCFRMLMGDEDKTWDDRGLRVGLVF